MDNMVAIAVAAVIGLVIGYLVGARGKSAVSATAVTNTGEDRQWWKLRESLTGTQLQILQYLEARKEASIAKLQEKFSFIPDRELFYRLEQIVLMGFVNRDRKHGEVVYVLNTDYAGHVEEDKTVILPDD